MVFISVSKIQFESKSQHITHVSKGVFGCLSVCQRYNLKANHNAVFKVSGFFGGVYQCVKDTIWKQITTHTQRRKIKLGCLSVCQRYNLKANHNYGQNEDKHWYGVYQCVKDTIWKQITTISRFCKVLTWVFISVSKIQFESKSQPLATRAASGSGCLSVCQRYNLKANHNKIICTQINDVGVYQCVKDTIWKQITTASILIQ